MKNIFFKISIILSLFLFTQPVFADDVKKRIEILGETGIALGDFMLLIVGVGGLILLFMGIWGLKNNAENPQQEPLKKHIIMILAGGLMAGFSAFQGLLSMTLTGESEDDRTGKFDATRMG